jgi:hypothetical protein
MAIDDRIALFTAARQSLRVNAASWEDRLGTLVYTATDEMP